MLSKQEREIFYKKIGLLIKAQRQKAGIKQEELSKRLGFKSRISIANIESGKQNIQLHTLSEMADFFGVTTVELIPPIEAVRKTVNPKLLKKIGKEDITDPDSVEKITAFIRLSTTKK